MVSVKFGSSDSGQELAVSVITSPGEGLTGLFCHPEDKDQLIALIEDIMQNGKEILSVVKEEFATAQEEEEDTCD